MAGKNISALSIALGATVGPFVSAVGVASHATSYLIGALNGAGSSLARMTGLSKIAGAALSAIHGSGSSLLGLFASFTGAGLAVNVLTGAFRKLVEAPGEAIAAAEEQSKAETNLRSVLAATGGAAGRTADQMFAYAKSLQDSTTFSDESIIGFQSTLATFKGVSGDTFDSATKAALDMSTVMGTDLQSSAVVLGKALSNPTDGLKALKRVGVTFTDAQKEQISTMQQAGDVAGAQGVILDALNHKYGGAAEAIAATPFGQLKQIGNAFHDVIETVGGTLATVGAMFAKAFDLKGVIGKLGGYLTTLSGVIETGVSTYLPVVIGFASAIWSAVVGYAMAIYNFVAPIIGQIVGVVRSNWSVIEQTTVAYWMAAYNLISSVVGLALQIVSAVWGAIVDVWTWGCGLVGYQTQDAGSTTGTAVQGIVDTWQWALSTITEIINVASYVISHIGDVVTYAATTVDYQLVRIATVFEYYLDIAIGYVVWFGQNFTSLIVDAFNVGQTITQNGVTNVANIIKNLPGLIAGTTDLADIWTPLTQGFQATASALPTIAERIPGDIESTLASQSQDLGDSLVDGLTDSLNKADANASDATSTINSTLGGIGDAFAAAVTPPAITPPVIPTSGIDQATDAMGDLNKATDKASQGFKTLRYGSAEAMADHAKTAYAMATGAFDKNNHNDDVDTSKPMTSDPNGSAAQVQPLSRRATTAIAKAGDSKSASKDETLMLLREWFAYFKANPGVDIAEAA